MKEIVHHKYSLFKLENLYGTKELSFSRACFEYINTFNSLDEAQDHQKHITEKTIIIPSY